MRLSRFKVTTTSLCTLFLATISCLSAQAQEASVRNFPFQEQAFRVRLQPGFFKVGSDLFEDILRSSGLVDDKDTLSFTDANGYTNVVRFKSLKTSIRIQDGRLVAAFKSEIKSGELYSKQIQGCSVLLKGQLAFAAVIEISPAGLVSVDIPQELYESTKLQTEKKNCGIVADIFAGPETIRDYMRDGLKEQLSQILNDHQFKLVQDPKIDSVLKDARVFVNIPSETKLTSQTKSNFAMAVGIRGAISNTNNGGRGMRIVPGDSKYTKGLGLEWTLDTGVKALSQNIHDSKYIIVPVQSQKTWPEWGRAPYSRLNQAINFDAALMLRGSFLRSLFANLYKAGFFNLQIQDSLLNKSMFALNPISWNELFAITLPNGSPLNKQNFRDMRIETSLAQAPEVSIKDSKSIDLLIPDLKMKLAAQSKSSGMFEVLQFRARFHVIASPELDEDGKLVLRFNEQPIENFQIISRSGVGKAITDSDIKLRLNQTIIEVLKAARVEIPLMKNRKITIPYMGIDNDKGNEVLAIYLKAAK